MAAGNISDATITDTELVKFDPTVIDRHLPPSATDFSDAREVGKERALNEARKRIEGDLEAVVPLVASDWSNALSFATLEVIYRGLGGDFFVEADHWERRLIETISRLDFRRDADDSGTIDGTELEVTYQPTFRIVR